MATIVLSAVGTAAGSYFGGGILGLSSAVIGRAVGATLGRVIDQRIMGSGSEVVESGKVDRFRLTGASEGAPIGDIYGRVRLSGQAIWATRFVEHVTTTGGSGKGGPPKPKVREYSYSVSLAVALCRGEISGVGRVWADGQEIATDDLNMRIYTGSDSQMPDPKIEAVEGAGQAPSYRGVAYVVLEDLDLGPFGNRVPQLSFEVMRPAPADLPGHVADPALAVRAVAMIPGSGEYALATTPVHFEIGPGENRSANVNSPSGKADFLTSLETLGAELPNCAATSLVVSWFGDDLRCGTCAVQPKVEQKLHDGKGMPWSVSGVDRAGAAEIAKDDDRPVYGGTPADASVIEAIGALREAGQAVTFYPFILMDQLDGNGLEDPWTGAEDQPVLPWRGRITLSVAPGREGSPDGAAGADAEVAAFIGTAAVSDFTQTATGVDYHGPAEWSYRRFILHNAHLCAAAGGVDAFCIGSEMRSWTQIRGASGFPAVQALKVLAADVRSILGPDCKISYAADWSEYFGYHPQDGSGDVYFHLDPLWADANIDFIGIDNYMPLSDWRDGFDHADADWGSIYNLDYLTANIAGGEGYDWYYAKPEHDQAQRRTPITDGSAGLSIGATLETAPIGQSEDFGDPARTETTFFHAQVRLPESPADAMLWEHGGTGRGAWLGVRDAGTVLRLRAGDGGAELTASSTETAVLDLPVADLPFDGQMHELAWELRPAAPGRVRLWIDGALVGEAETSDGSALEDGEWSGGNPSNWVIYEGSSIAAGEPSVSWPVPDASPLYRSVLQDEAPTESPWVYRYKDIRNWWANRHYDRRGGRPVVQPSPWLPESKPIWFTELGCAAIDKGTNQPNKFVDPKSSESQLPKYSNGRRDDFIQMQYLRAMTSFFAETENNPVSAAYGGPMVDMTKAHVWAWDARPYPFFPNNAEVWSDGGNYLRGHWLNGRGSSRSLAGVVAEICEASGVTQYDVSELHGVVRGYAAGEVDTGRAGLQPLMLAHGFDAVERNGTLVFRNRDGRAGAEVDTARLAVSPEAETDLLTVRAPVAEVAGRLRLSFVEADADFATRAEEAVFPDEATHSVAASEVPLVLTRTEARGIVERWLAEARVARDTAKFSLPLSQLAVRAGDVVRLPSEDGVADYRIDRVDQSEFQMLEAVRVEPEIYQPSDAVEVAARAKPFVAPVPVYPIFLDLPLLRGDEVPHAPHLAVSARPWPGSVAVYGSASDDGYELNRLIAGAATVGMTETPLLRAAPGVVDRGASLRVKLVSGVLASAGLNEILNGANAAAIGDGSSGNWEVFQFQDADLIAGRTYELTGRLRGQAGTDGVMPDVWLPGSTFVLLNGAPQQIDLAVSSRGLARHYRIGPAQRSFDDPSYVHKVEAFDGNGLRPYAPVHLRAARDGAGAVHLSWIRRTRIDGDSWQSVEVPLGEDNEVYQIRVLQSGSVIRDLTVTTTDWTYDSAAQSADGLTGAFDIEVAQLSDRFGPGPFRRITINE